MRSSFTVLIAMSAAVGSLTAHAAPEGTPMSASASVLTHGVDLELGYRDAFLNDRRDTGAPRALGLDRARVALDWRSQRTASIALVLRPDALSRAKATEVDRRAGVSYRPESELRFLDSYLLSIYPVSSLATSLGVFEELAPARRSYPATLDFGLGVRLPTRFAGLRLRWQSARTAPATAVPSAAGTLLADAYFLHGDGDRLETQGERRGAYDRAPVARDAHQGGAAQIAWVPVDELEVSVLWGTLDEKVEGGKRHEVMVNAVAAYRIDLGPAPTKASLDVRRVTEAWRGVDESRREQRSASLTFSSRVIANAWILLGVHFGSSQRQQEVEVDGRQLEAGILGTLGEELTVQFLVADERREEVDRAGAHRGGFLDQDGDAAKLRRYGMTLAYELEGKN